MPMTILQNIMRKTMFIVQSDLPQSTKDKAISMFKQSVDFVLEESSPQKINQLVYNELKKKQAEKLKTI